MKPKASTILDTSMYTNPSNRSHHILWKENRQICNILHVTTQQCKAQTNKQTNKSNDYSFTVHRSQFSLLHGIYAQYEQNFQSFL